MPSSGSGFGPGFHVQFAEDTPAQDGDLGYMVLAVRQNTPNSLAGTDGDYSPLTVVNGGGLLVSSAGGAQGSVTVTSMVNAAVSVISMVNAAVTLLAGTAAVGSVTDGGPSWSPVHGITVVNGAINTHIPFTAALNGTGGIVTDTPTTAANAGFLVITDIIASSNTACTLTFTEETSGYVITGPWHMSANAPVQLTPRGGTSSLGTGWHTYTANKRMLVVPSVNATVTVDAFYYSTTVGNS